MNRLNQNQQNSTRLTQLAANGSWLNAIFNATGLLVTVAVLSIAVKNLSINTQTLASSEENLANTKLNAGNSTEIINQLKSINQKLDRL